MSDLGKVIMIYSVFALIILIALAFFYASAIEAHEWYDGDCCSELHCHPVKEGIVDDAADGGVDVKGWGHVYPNDSRLRPSQDTEDHLCIDKTGGIDSLRCVYHVRRSF